MVKRLFIGIAVARPVGMQTLPKVYDSMNRLCDYVASYEDDFDAPIVFSDHGGTKVTSEQIREVLHPSILLNRPRILIYFIGHGAFVESNQVWYLSEGRDQPYQRVNVGALQEVLETYGPEQLCIFSDACQTPEVGVGGAVPLLDKNIGEFDFPLVDSFRSTAKGMKAFASKEYGPIFTHAVLEAIHGDDGPPALAIDRLHLEKDRIVVSSQSLRVFLKSRVKELATLIQRNQKPRMHSGLDYFENDYLEVEKLPPSLEGSTFLSKTDSAISHSAREQRNEEEEIKRSAASAWRRDFWDHSTDLSHQFGYGTGAIISLGTSANGSPIEGPSFMVSRSASERFDPKGDENDPGGHYFLSKISGNRHADVLRYDDLYVPIQFQSGFYTAISMAVSQNDSNKRGVNAMGWIYSEAGTAREPDRLSSMQMFKGLVDGIILPEDIPFLAKSLRRDKHVDMLFGLVAAYLYDEVGDIEGIRRLAGFYPCHGQDIPFDIALLCRLEFQVNKNGQFEISIPAVSEDKRSQNAGLPDYVWKSMPALENVRIAGLAPVFRSGWGRLSLNESSSLFKELGDLQGFLADSPVATIQGHCAGTELVQLFARFMEK